MAKEKFERQLLTYIGPVSSFHIVAASTGEKDAVPNVETRPLITGETYDDLPVDHPIISNLIAHQLLVTPTGDFSDPTPPETTVPDSVTANGGDGSTSTQKPKTDKPAK